MVLADLSFDDLVCVATAVSLATEKLAVSKDRVAHLARQFLDGISTR